MKNETKKLVYWWLPVVAFVLQIGTFKFLDLVFQLESNPPSPFYVLGNILAVILGILLILVGYLIACLYKRVKYKGFVLVYAVLFFFALQVLIDSPDLIHHDFGTEDNIWGIVVQCMKWLWIWNSYPVILSILLHGYSKKIVYPDEY